MALGAPRLRVFCSRCARRAGLRVSMALGAPQLGSLVQDARGAGVATHQLVDRAYLGGRSTAT
eukprot:13487611-Heterocapsa_arctica.AAC.1